MRFRLGISNFRDVLAELRSFLGANWKLCLAILVYITFFSAIMIFKHNSFLTSGFDLGIFNQTFWTTLFEDRLFYSTGDLSFNPSGSFFGVHFSPILFLLLPFYAIYPRVETLLVIQSIVLALGAIPIYWMAHEKLGKNVALYISILYLVYPPLNYVNLNDFHLEALLPTLFLFAVYYLEHEKWPQFLVFIILSMATIEFTQIIVIFVAIYGLLVYRKRRFVDSRKALKYIILTVCIGVLCFVLALKIKELFNPITSPVPTPFHIIFSNPGKAVYMIFNDWSSKVFYIICLLGPLGFLPALSLEPVVMTIPWIGASFITDYLPYYSIYYHYNSFVFPFVFIALVKVIERIKVIRPKLVKRISLALFLSTAVFALYLPFATTSPWMYRAPISTERNALVHESLSLVPSNASILTQNNIFPHVSGRLEAYMYIPQSSYSTIEYILVDVTSFWYSWIQPQQFGERPPPSDFVQRALESREYGTIVSAEGILLLRKGYVDETMIFVPYKARCDYRTISIHGGNVIEDTTSTSTHVLYHGKEDPEGLFWYGPKLSLPPGLYNITYFLKIGSEVNPNDELIRVDVATHNNETVLAEKLIFGEQVPSKDRWFNVTLTVGLNNVAENVEFRGWVYSNYEVYLDYISIKQISPKPS